MIYYYSPWFFNLTYGKYGFEGSSAINACDPDLVT